MKLIRFTIAESPQIHWGIVEGNQVKPIVGDPFSAWQFSGEQYRLAEVKLKAPVDPRHIIGIGKNYLADNEERPKTLPEIPVFFYKPVTTVIGPNENIVLPSMVEEVKFESELAVVIGKEAYNISKEQVADHIFGYTVANDVTAFSLFHPDGHWTLGKAADTFTPIGPILTTELDLSAIKIRSILNGKEMQNSGLDKIIIGINEMISYLSNILTLLPGDVILTGAPAGAEFMKAGDAIECIIDGIGTLRNTVVKK